MGEDSVAICSLPMRWLLRVMRRPITPPADAIEDEALPVGKMIAIKPNDYGQEETVGEIVWVTAEALAVKRTDEQVGDVLVHYPRLGYLFEARA